MGGFRWRWRTRPLSHFAIEVLRCHGAAVWPRVPDSFFWLHRVGHRLGSFDQGLGEALEVADSGGKVGWQFRDRGRRTEDHVVVDALVSQTALERGGLPADEALELVEHVDPLVMVVV